MDKVNELEIAMMDSLIKNVSSRAKCYRANCYGRGYTSITTYLGKDNLPHLRLMLCDCGVVGTSEYAKLHDLIADNTTMIIDKMKSEVYDKSVLGRIVIFVEKVKSWIIKISSVKNKNDRSGKDR
jgi:hypothetical protein